MSVNPAPLPVAFQGGVDTRTDSKQVATVKLLDLQNAVFTHKTTLSKRNGHRALSTEIQNGGGLITNARGLGKRDDERLLFTDQRCYSYRPSADRWADTGPVAATTATTLPIARTGTYQTQPDVADRHGIRVVAWEDSIGGVWCQVSELETDGVLLKRTALDSSANAKNPRCIAVGDVIHVLWTREDLGFIQLAVINPAVPNATPVAVTLTADLDTTKPFYDAEGTINGDGRVDAFNSDFLQRPGIIAWAQAGGGFRVGWIAPSGVLGSPATQLASVATFADLLNGPIAVSWDCVSLNVAVVFASAASSTPAVKFLNGLSLTTVLRAGSLGVPAAIASRITCAHGETSTPTSLIGGVPLLYWAAEITGARSDLTTVVSGAVNQGNSALDAISTTLLGHGLVSRAWHDGAILRPDENTGFQVPPDGDVYVLIAHTVRFSPYLAALRLSGKRNIDSSPSIAAPDVVIVSRLLPGEASGSLMRPTGAGTRAWTQHLPTVTQLDLVQRLPTATDPIDRSDVYSRRHAVVVPYRIQLSSQNGDQFSEQGLKLVTLDMQPAYRTQQLGKGLYLSSSAPMHYDGAKWREADFHCAPDFGFDAAGAPVDMAASIGMVGGGSIANGTYLYAYWYEALDAQGELHRGPVSVKMLVTMSGGPRSFQHAIPTCRLTRFNIARICVARSEQGATGTDSTIPLYRVTSNDVTVTTGSNRFILNDPTVSVAIFTDGLDDTTLKTREPLYTNGGILSNNPAPWHGGVLAVGKSRLFWTDTTDPHIVRYSQQIADDTALEAPVDLSLRKDPFGGAITAIGVMDDTIVPFSSTAVYIFGGPGPLSDPSAAPEANAFSPIELVSTDVGCTQIASIGQTPVGLTFKSGKGIMMLTRSRQIVRIGDDVQAYDGQNVMASTLVPNAQRIIYLTDVGRTLVWDYDVNQWSTNTNHEGLDAMVVDGLYCYLRTDSRVFVETPGLYRDDNSNIPMVIETAWIHFAQYLQGWQRILYAYFLGKFISEHTLSIRYRLDYNDSYSPEILSDVNSNRAFSAYGSGSYGVGPYGGAGGAGTRYQRRIHINKRSQSISFLIKDIEATGDFGASFELSELLLIGGGIGPDFKVGAARSA